MVYQYTFAQLVFEVLELLKVITLNLISVFASLF